MNYAPRVSIPYDDMSGVIGDWADTCNQMAVYEHLADDTVKRTHVHILMIDCKYKTPEQLKNIFKKYIKTDRKGNELWKWEESSYGTPDISFLKYMSKGIHSAKFLKNITPQEAEQQRLQWVNPIPKAVTLRQTSLDEDAKKKKTKYCVVLEVVKLILAKHPLAITDERQQAILNMVEDEQVLKTIRRVLISDNQVLGLYKVMDIYDAFVMYHQKEKFLSNCLNVLNKRLPRV